MIAIRVFITAAFALSYDSPHDFAGKGMLNDMRHDARFCDSRSNHC